MQTDDKLVADIISIIVITNLSCFFTANNPHFIKYRKLDAPYSHFIIMHIKSEIPFCLSHNIKKTSKLLWLNVGGRAKINCELELVSEIKIVLNHKMTENMLEWVSLIVFSFLLNFFPDPYNACIKSKSCLLSPLHIWFSLLKWDKKSTLQLLLAWHNWHSYKAIVNASAYYKIQWSTPPP